MLRFGAVPLGFATDAPRLGASTVDPDTVIFAGAEPVRWTMEDVDNDGDIDMLFHFNAQDLDLDENSTEATLLGTTG